MRQAAGHNEVTQPSSTASSREELAQGTPAQQSPPVASQVATPSGKPLFIFPDPRNRMQPGSVAHMLAQTPQAGRPPPPSEGYARPHSSRDDGRMRFTPAFHGQQVTLSLLGVSCFCEALAVLTRALLLVAALVRQVRSCLIKRKREQGMRLGIGICHGIGV